MAPQMRSSVNPQIPRCQGLGRYLFRTLLASSLLVAIASNTPPSRLRDRVDDNDKASATPMAQYQRPIQTSRTLQTTTDTTTSPNKKDHLQKCFDSLEQAASEKLHRDGAKTLQITQSDYIDFLRVLSNGSVNVTSFAELSATFVMIFYATACTDERDCTTEPPVVPVAQNGIPVDGLAFFCTQLLKFTYSTLALAFEFTIRYTSTTSVASEYYEELSSCLETAAINLLLDQVGDCPVSDPIRRGRQQRRLVEDPLSLRSPRVDSAFFGPNKPRTTRDMAKEYRMLQDTSGDLPTNDCMYAVSMEAFRLTDYRK
jgi:hypothetical protein